LKLIRLIKANIRELLFITLAFTLMVSVSYIYASGIVRKNIDANAQETLLTGSSVMEALLREAELVTLQSTLAVRNIIEGRREDGAIERYVRNVQAGLTNKRNSVTGFMFIGVFHALRGAARSVGAAEFADLAGGVETAARNGDRALIEKCAPELLRQLRRLLEDIQAALDSRRAETAESGDLSVLGLEKLRSALLGMDIQTVNSLLLEYAALPLKGAMKKNISDIEQYILMFEYDKAVDYINTLLF
jgi:HPt (histidine-containing phosphotransfer) domain-containing protein